MGSGESDKWGISGLGYGSVIKYKNGSGCSYLIIKEAKKGLVNGQVISLLNDKTISISTREVSIDELIEKEAVLLEEKTLLKEKKSWGEK